MPNTDEPFSSRWTEHEIKLALLLYFQIPFGKIDRKNGDIIKLASKIGRTPSAVAMKMLNLSSLDQAITTTGRVGLKNASVLDQEVWAWYQADWSSAVEEAETLLDDENVQTEEGFKDVTSSFYGFSSTRPTEVEALAVRRRGQQFFRNSVLANFEQKCCVTGIDIPELLCASHILPWAFDVSQRLNPANGLCLSLTLDRAFDRGFVCFREDSTLCISTVISSDAGDTQAYFGPLADIKMRVPQKMAVSAAFLNWHRANTFERWL